MCVLKDLTKKCGTPIPPGNRAILYGIPAEEVLSMPTVGDGSVPGNTKVYETAWSLTTESGKGYWRTIPIVANSGQETFNMVGERGGRSFENGQAFMLAGTDAENKEFAECLSNGCWIFMIKDRADDHPNVFGRNDDAAYAKEISGDGGKAPGDQRGISFVIGDDTGKIPFKYDSALAINTTPNA